MIIPPEHQPKKPDSIMGITVRFSRRVEVAQARGIWPFKRIVVGHQWYWLSERERMAVLLHEVGHCKLFHMEKRVAMLWVLLTRPELAKAVCREQEMEADEFAVSRGYGVELRAFVCRSHAEQGPFYPDRKERLRNLNNLLQGGV